MRVFYRSRYSIDPQNQGIIRQAALVLLISFLGVYVLRGLFENAYINQVGILLGLMLALRYSLLNQPSATPTQKIHPLANQFIDGM